MAISTKIWQIVSVAIFYIIMIIIGIYAAKRGKNQNKKSEESYKTKKSADDFLLAGRSISLFVGCFTMTATWVGGAYINGTAEVAYNTGIIWLQGPIGYSFSLFIGGLFFAKKMRREGYVTMLDPIQLKYGKFFGALCVIPPVLGDIFWSASILVALGSTVAVIQKTNLI